MVITSKNETKEAEMIDPSESRNQTIEMLPLPCASWCRMCEDIQHCGELEPCSVCSDCNVNLGAALDHSF